MAEDIEENDKINRIEINTPTPETQKSEEKNAKNRHRVGKNEKKPMSRRKK